MTVMRQRWRWIAAGTIVALVMTGLAIYLRLPLPLLLDWRPLPTTAIQEQLTNRAAALALTAEARRRAVEQLAKQPAHSHWTTFTSVNQINDLLLDGETLWVASNGGLARWDTTSAEALKLTTDHGLPSNTVTALALDADGALWLGTDAGAVQVRPDASLRRFTVADGLADPFIYAVLGTSDGAVWFATPEGATRLGRDGQVRTVRFLSPWGLLTPRFADVVAIAEGPDGAVWLSTPVGIRIFYADGRQRFLSDADLGRGRVTAFAFAPDGAVLMTVNAIPTARGVASSVFRLTPDRRLERVFVIEEQAGQEAISGSRFRDLAPGADGLIWVATESGVIRLRPDGTHTLIGAAPESDVGLLAPGVGVQRVVPDADGSIWFGTDRGITRLLADGNWQALQDSEGPGDSSNRITALARAPNGDLWVGAQQALSRFDGRGAWKQFLPDLLTSEITALEVDAFGDLWVGTGQGLLRVTPDLPEQLQIPDSPDWPATARVTTLAAMADGSLWVGTSFEGVFWRDAGGNWRAYSGADGLGGNTVYAIAAVPDGSLWFGTESGLSRLTVEGQWQRFGQVDGLPVGAIRGLRVLADGSLLLAASDIAEGSSLMRRSADGRWQTLLAPGGAVRSSILCLAVAPDATIWIGTATDGLLRLGIDGALQTFTAEDGLAGNSVNALLVTPDGTLWVATDRGVSRYAQ
ncbi:MAG: ligand-binding sensor domain-containing protein [Chloroflexaceae bacterium]